LIATILIPERRQLARHLAADRAVPRDDRGLAADRIDQRRLVRRPAMGSLIGAPVAAGWWTARPCR
jgi:hypothetical protein